MSKTVPLTVALRAEYARLFDSCVIREERESTVEWYVKQALRHRARYEALVELLPLPWWWVAIVHGLEGGFDFKLHLHNGDPLSARTRRVPAGRPVTGEPPFSWEASARDALILKDLHKMEDWTLGNSLYQWERYNGFGYRLYHPEVPTPYLWAGSTLYSKGKYIRDHVFSPSTVSQQIGAAVILRGLVDRREVCLCA